MKQSFLWKKDKNKPKTFWLVFFTLIFLALGLYFGLRWGAVSFSHRELTAVLSQPFKQSKSQNILIDIRLPRMLAALLVGAAMSVAGSMMQGITRNPIADPGLLGINAGAGLALVLASVFFKGLHYSQILLVCILGAVLAALLVFTLSYSRQRGYDQLRLVLAGAMIATLFSAIGQALTISFRLSGSIIGWQAGGLVGVNWRMLAALAPLILISLLLALVFAHQLTILSLEENVAKALGQRTLLTTLFLLGLVKCLSAASVALVGSLSFVGLIIPHLVRLFSPRSYRVSLPLTALSGAVFMLWVDLVCRTVNPPYETPLNAVISLLGLPCFILLVRRGKHL